MGGPFPTSSLIPMSQDLHFRGDGYEALGELSQNLRLGIEPHSTYARVRSGQGVALDDLIAGAGEASDPQDREALKQSALQEGARQLGRADARRDIERLERPLDANDVAQVRQLWQAGWDQEGIEPTNAPLYMEYYKGYAKEVADAFVRSRDPAYHRQARMEARLSSEGRDLVAVQEDAHRSSKAIPRGDDAPSEQWARAVVRADHLESAAREAARGRFLEFLDEVTLDDLDVDTAIREARRRATREAAGASPGYEQQALLQVAWMSLPRSEAEAHVQSRSREPVAPSADPISSGPEGDPPRRRPTMA